MEHTEELFKEDEDYDNDDKKEKVAIANMCFAYANKELINLLRERGRYLTKGQVNKIPKIEAKINKIVKEKRKELIRPIYAFITFKYQEGMERCINEFETKDNFWGYPIFHEKALEILDVKLGVK